MRRILYKLRGSKITYAVIIVVLMIALGILIMINLNRDKAVTLTLINESIDLEYGESISFDAADYLDDKEVDKQVIEETEVTSDAQYETYTTVNEDGEEITGTYDYPAVGEYTITLTYDKSEVTIQLSVKDTTTPEFINLLEEYEVTDGETLDMSQFSAKDYSNITITLDDEDVDYETTGSYTATLTAADIYNNQTSADIKVIVTIEEDEEEEEETTSSDSTTSNASNSSSSTNSSSSSSSNKSNNSSSNSSSSSSSSSNTSTSTNSNESSNSSDTEDTTTENQTETSDDSQTQETDTTNDSEETTDSTSEEQESDATDVVE